MNLQTIKLNGQEFVLLPAICYKRKKKQIDKFVSEIADSADTDEYVPFVIEDYFDNPIALERIKRRVTQKKLAALLGCSQAYVSQLENSQDVSATAIARVKEVLKRFPDQWSKVPR